MENQVKDESGRMASMCDFNAIIISSAENEMLWFNLNGKNHKLLLRSNRDARMSRLFSNDLCASPRACSLSTLNSIIEHSLISHISELSVRSLPPFAYVILSHFKKISSFFASNVVCLYIYYHLTMSHISISDTVSVQRYARKDTIWNEELNGTKLNTTNT